MTELIVTDAIVGGTVTRLVDGARELVIGPETGFSRASLDIGSASVRAVSQPRPGRDGEDDTTAHHGSAAVTLQLLLKAGPGRTLTSLLDSLRSFCHPAARPFLVVEKDGTQRRIRLRAEQGTAPITNPNHQQVQVGWRAPDGVWESLAEKLGVAEAIADTVAGFGFPLTFPLTFPASSAVGSVTVVNDGNTVAWPVLRLHGPYDGPRVENQSTGERMLFTGLTVAAGDWLEIDCREHTVRLNGLAEQSRLSRLDFAASEFLRLLPGANTLRFFPVSFGTGARLEVRYHSTGLL